jgi:hypothetical protein
MAATPSSTGHNLDDDRRRLDFIQAHPNTVHINDDGWWASRSGDNGRQFKTLREAVDFAMGVSQLIRDIAIDDLRPGDHFRANVANQDHSEQWTTRICTLVEIVGKIYRVKTATRKKLVAIGRERIIGTGWGMRP